MEKFLKYFIFFVLIISIELYPNDKQNELQDIHTEFDSDYAIKGTDSIKIINYTMRYALGWSFKKINFESNSFIEYKEYPLQNIIDSLKKRYLLLKYYHFSQYTHDTFIDSGFVVSFVFLIDLRTFYNLDVFSNDKFLLTKINYYLTKGNYNKKKIIEKLLETKKYGILAFKDTNKIHEWKILTKDSLFKEEVLKDDLYKEYLKLLKKLPKRKKY